MAALKMSYWGHEKEMSCQCWARHERTGVARSYCLSEGLYDPRGCPKLFFTHFVLIKV